MTDKQIKFQERPDRLKLAFQWIKDGQINYTEFEELIQSNYSFKQNNCPLEKAKELLPGFERFMGMKVTQ